MGRNILEEKSDLRAQVEKQIRRNITDNQWLEYGPDWEGPYGDADRAEIVERFRDIPPPGNALPQELKSQFRLARRQREAFRQRKLVESLRTKVFGEPKPPFENDAVGAALWIEAQTQQPEEMLITIEAALKAQDADFPALIEFNDKLTQAINRATEQGGTFSDFLANADFVRNIGGRWSR